MKLIKISCYIILFNFFGYVAHSQTVEIVQLSGLVVTESNSDPVPLPFAEIRIKSTNRGVFSNENGFFSIAVKIGDTLQFRYIGYKDAIYIALKVDQGLRDIAEENLAQDRIRKMLEFTPHDGQSNASYYLKTEAQKAYYNGQFRPMNIMSPSAWIEFFKAWKRGDFKIMKNKYE